MADFSAELKQGGEILTGGEQLVEGDLGKGYFCAPTLAYAPADHRLWMVEMFLPITTIMGYTDVNVAMEMATMWTMA